MKTLRLELKNAIRIFSLLLVLLVPLTSWAAAGKVVIAAGEVFAIDAQEQRRPLQRRSDIFEGDTLVTGADGRLQLRFEDNAILALRADSQLRISEYHGATDSQNERVLMDLLGGGFRTISGSFGKSERDAYQVRTPNASIGIRGTHYEAVFQSDTLTVGVYEGGIVLTNDQGSLNLGLDSEFVFAQVQAGNLPQGLLNPPANLNVPNTPESDDENEEEGDEETSPDETNPDEPEDIAAIPVTTTDDNDFSADDFNLTDLEDAFIELQEKSVVLTEAEREGLQNYPSVVGILVMAPSETGNNGRPISENGPMIAYGAITQSEGGGIGDGNGSGDGNENGNGIGIGNGGSPFFVAYEDQSATENLDNPPNFVLRPTAASPYPGGDTLFPWQEWNDAQEQGSTGTTDAGENTGFNAGIVQQPFFFIEAEPTQANLSGTKNFYLSDLVTYGGGSINSSQIPNSNSMTVEFGNLSAFGNITFDDTNSNTWTLDFEGNIQGVTLNAELVSSSNISNGEEIDSGLNGNVNGIFTGGGGGQTPLGMTGGFTAQSDDGQFEDYGVFQMHEEQPN